MVAKLKRSGPPADCGSKAKPARARVNAADGAHDDQTPQGALGEGAIRGLLGYQLAQAAVVTSHAFEREVGKPLELRPVEFTILQLLSENPLASPTQLARALDISLPGIKQWLDRLAERSLVERQTRDADRRSHRLVLTPAGHELLVLSVDKLLQADSLLLEALSAGERLLLLELLRKVARLRAV